MIAFTAKQENMHKLQSTVKLYQLSRFIVRETYGNANTNAGDASRNKFDIRSKSFCVELGRRDSSLPVVVFFFCRRRLQTEGFKLSSLLHDRKLKSSLC